MAKNWRSMKLNDFPKKKRIWFSILTAQLIIALVAAGLCGAEVIYIPNWIAGISIIVMVGTLYKFLNESPELFVDASDKDDD